MFLQQERKPRRERCAKTYDVDGLLDTDAREGTLKDLVVDHIFVVAARAEVHFLQLHFARVEGVEDLADGHSAGGLFDFGHVCGEEVV